MDCRRVNYNHSSIVKLKNNNNNKKHLYHISLYSRAVNAEKLIIKFFFFRFCK